MKCPHCGADIIRKVLLFLPAGACAAGGSDSSSGSLICLILGAVLVLLSFRKKMKERLTFVHSTLF